VQLSRSPLPTPHAPSADTTSSSDTTANHHDPQTIANPPPTNFAITVQATPSGAYYSNADFNLRIKSLPITDLNFDSQLNTNHLSNFGFAILADGHKNFYRVQVPQLLAGEPVIGWKLSLSTVYGNALMRIRRDALPDGDAFVSMTFNAYGYQAWWAIPDHTPRKSRSARLRPRSHSTGEHGGDRRLPQWVFRLSWHQRIPVTTITFINISRAIHHPCNMGWLFLRQYDPSNREGKG